MKSHLLPGIAVAAGDTGIDFECTESNMLSAVVQLGFMGLRPDGQARLTVQRTPARPIKFVCSESRFRIQEAGDWVLTGH